MIYTLGGASNALLNGMTFVSFREAIEEALKEDNRFVTVNGQLIFRNLPEDTPDGQDSIICVSQGLDEPKAV